MAAKRDGPRSGENLPDLLKIPIAVCCCYVTVIYGVIVAFA